MIKGLGGCGLLALMLNKATTQGKAASSKAKAETDILWPQAKTKA